MPLSSLYFLDGYSMWHHYFAVATGSAISSSWGRQYGPVFSLSFLDVYDLNPRTWGREAIVLPPALLSIALLVILNREVLWNEEREYYNIVTVSITFRQFHKTFFLRQLWLSQKTRAFVPVKPLLPSLKLERSWGKCCTTCAAIDCLIGYT